MELISDAALYLEIRVVEVKGRLASVLKRKIEMNISILTAGFANYDKRD